MATVGSGEYTYEPVENWAKLPPGWSFKEIGGVGVDRNDNVYVFNRGEHPMIVFDRDGNFLRSWGEGLFPRAHGVLMAPDDTIWLTDDGDHTVRQCTLEGKVLLTLGISGKPAPYMSGEPFHRCTHTAMSPQGDIYVSDGYGNSRVHKYTPERQAADVLGRARHRSGRVQHRAQHHLRCRRLGLRRRPREPSRAGVRRQRQIRDAVEQSAPPVRPVHAARQVPDLLHRRTRRQRSRSTATCRISARASPSSTTPASALRGSAGCGPGLGPTEFMAPHGLAVDSRGDLYVGEVSWTNWPQTYTDKPRPDNLRSLHKFRKVGA